jgi:O-antigen/teichoic acid export membrane protein
MELGLPGTIFLGMRGLSSLGRWLAASGVDVIGRLLVQILVTLLLARILAPEAFGASALAFSIVGVLQMVVGTPFEEVLVQRAVARKSHFSAALAVTVAACALLLPGTLVLAAPLARLMDVADLSVLLPVAALLLPLAGVSAIYTALARRHRRFPLIALANLAGHGAGGLAGAILGVMGAGVWSLVAWRIGLALVTALVLIWAQGGVLRPRWRSAALMDLRGFTLVNLADRVVEVLSLALLNVLVNAGLGVVAVGFLNMALRLVEPIRGAVGGIGHNIAFSFFSRAQAHPDRLGRATLATIGEVGMVTAPVFLGLAAVMPVLLPLAAGEGWESAVPIAQALALGAALATPMGFGFSALAALGRPKYGLVSSLLALLALCVVPPLAASLGPLAAGLARMLADGVEVLYLLRPLGRRLGLGIRAVPGALSRPLAAALPMAALVLALGAWVAPETTEARAWTLAGQVLLGMVLFPLGALVLARAPLRSLAGRVAPGRFPPGGPGDRTP